MLMKLCSSAVVILVIAGIAGSILPAIANDSSAELATGGLIFTKNPYVELRKEDLFISTREIRVRYVFFNKSERDITNTVAFPMPDIVSGDPSSNVVIPTDDPENFLGFSTVAAGRAVSARVEQKIFARGIDQTAHLRRFGIPLAPHLESTQAALDTVPREEWSRLIDLGLVEKEEYSTGAYPHTVTKEHLVARWTLKTAYYWQQTFPAQLELVIEHRYKPSVGEIVVTMLGNADPALERLNEYQQKYCTDADFIDTVTRARRAGHDTYAPFEEMRIEYILTTGANWAGPIGEFRLVIDKGAPENLTSFCGQGVKKIGPTQFEMTKMNFIPQDNLAILILQRQQPLPDSRPLAPVPSSRESLLPTGSCDELWYQRNSIFKAAGYCFKTSRAIRTFGNAGCQYDDAKDIPLSERQRQTLTEIRISEVAKRCAR
jgi:hypothetical protein